MTMYFPPPFKVTPRLRETSSRNPDEVSLRRLREIVAGREEVPDFPRTSAIHLLAFSDLPTRHRDLEAVLENEREPENLRRVAANHLGKINTPAAIQILVENISTGSQQVLAGILKALGRVGGTAELEAVLKAKEYATGHAAQQAAFAAALISHREGLAGNELPMPDEGSYLKIPEGAARLEVTRAAPSDAEMCLRSLASQPFGIEYAEQSIYQLRCVKTVLMILLNRKFAGSEAMAKAAERKALPCVVATRNEETGSYSVSFLLLSKPARVKGEIDLLVTRSTGDPVLAGTARTHGDRAEFHLRAISRPGAVGIELAGAFAGGKLEFTNARSALVVQVPKSQPLPFRRREKIKPAAS